MKKSKFRKLNVMENYGLMRDVLMTNRIYNMDCLEGLRKMPDDSVDLILSDPPYCMETKKGKGTGVVKNSPYLKEIDYMCNGFDLRILDECMRVLRGIAFFFCSKDQIPMYFEYFADKGMNIQVLTWSKTDVPPLCCGKYLSDTEYIIYAYRADSADKYPLITVTLSLKGSEATEMILCIILARSLLRFYLHLFSLLQKKEMWFLICSQALQVRL